MRTTVNLDEHLLADAKALAAQTGKTLSEVVEDALRAALVVAEAVARRGPVELPVHHGGGLQPGFDLDDSAALVALEDEERWTSSTSTSRSTRSTRTQKTTPRTATG